MLGCGNVGAALVRLLDSNADLITQRSGVRLEVARVAVHNVAKERDVELAPGVLTNDADASLAIPRSTSSSRSSVASNRPAASS